MDDVQNPLRQARLHQQLAEPDGRKGHLLRGLQNKRVATGQRYWDHPQWDHYREVERYDTSADADWVADRLTIDVACDVRQCLAHQEARNSAGELDHLDPALEDRGSRFAQRLAVLAGDEARQFVGLFDQSFVEPE